MSVATREIYYTYRNEQNVPKVFVCLIPLATDLIARGIAICSRLDHPNKKIGRAIARGRALAALEEGGVKRREISRPEARSILEEVNSPYWSYKSRIINTKSSLTTKERTLLEKVLGNNGP